MIHTQLSLTLKYTLLYIAQCTVLSPTNGENLPVSDVIPVSQSMKNITRSQNFRAERDYLVQPTYFTGGELKPRECGNVTTSLQVSEILT